MYLVKGKQYTSMKTLSLVLAITLLAATAGICQEVVAPRTNRPTMSEAQRGQRMQAMNPLWAALDINKDGTIDDYEMKNAEESLKALDKNKDGKITIDEIRPVFPQGQGPGQGRGQGGPGRGSGASRPQQ